MLNRLLADLIVVLHFAFVLYAVFGGLLVMRWPRSVVLHLPALAWGVLVEAVGWVCPLTPLENRLRRAAGEAGYSTGFVEEYVLPVLYPADLVRPAQWVLAALLVLVNVAVYAVVWRRASLPGAKGCGRGGPAA